MTLEDLLDKGMIAVSDEIEFRTHADVLRLFGKPVKLYQRAMAKHPHEPDLHIWFPTLRGAENEDWDNSLGVNEETLFERRKFENEEYLKDLLSKPELHKRVVFVKAAPHGRAFYKFKGVFELDPDLCTKAKKAAYRRVSVSITLYPVRK